MKNLVRLAVVVAVALGLVTTVIQLERRYVPHKPAEWHKWLAAPRVEEATQIVPESAALIDGLGLANETRKSPPVTTSTLDPSSQTRRGDRGGLATANLPATTGTEADRSQSSNSPPAPSPPPPGRLVEAIKAQPLQPGVAHDANVPAARPLEPDKAGPANQVRSASLDDARADRSARQSERALRSTETESLIRQLASTDEEVAKRVRAELSLRGFGDVELDVASKVVDTDPEVRQQVARALPRLQSVDAGPWLLWLSRDENRDVRLTAITLLATTGDPKLLEQVESIAGRDPDPQIREQLERITQQRQSISSRAKSAGRRR